MNTPKFTTDTAIILAAGTGSRLFPMTKDRPKCLVDFEGETVLGFQLKKLSKVGFKKVIVATGSFVREVEKYVANLKLGDLQVVLEYNPFYYCSNNLISLWMLRHVMNEAFVLMNGDIIFDTGLLEKIKQSPGIIDLGYRKSKDFDDDDMKVILDGNKILQVAKDLSHDKAGGESLGMLHFSQEGAQILKGTMNELIKDKEYLNRFYLSAIQKMVDNGVPITGVDLEPGRWFELDFPKDYEIVLQNIRQLS